MGLEKGMRDYFLADNDVATLIGDRLYPRRAPQTAAKPYVVFNLISDVDLRVLRGYAGLTSALYQLDVFAATALAARAVGEALFQAIGRDGFKGTWDGVTVQLARWTDKRDDLVPPFAGDDVGIPQYSLDLAVWYVGT